MRRGTAIALAVLLLIAAGLFGMYFVTKAGNAKAKQQSQKDEEEAKLDRPVVTKDLKVGEGEAVDTAYRCMIEYVGKPADGEIPFDRNDQKDDDGKATKPPYVVVIGAGKSVKGLEEGMKGMKKGGERVITIPWQKGYGLTGTPDGNIPPKTDLEFTVKLIDFVTPMGNEEYDYTDVKVGGGREAKGGDRVTIHYRASYANGLVFDDSRKRGAPYVFKIGGNDAILGVDYGTRGMKVGGIRKIWMPPGLVFGENGYSVIQAGQIINVEVELLGIE